MFLPRTQRQNCAELGRWPRWCWGIGRRRAQQLPAIRPARGRRPPSPQGHVPGCPVDQPLNYTVSSCTHTHTCDRAGFQTRHRRDEPPPQAPRTAHQPKPPGYDLWNFPCTFSEPGGPQGPTPWEGAAGAGWGADTLRQTRRVCGTPELHFLADRIFFFRIIKPLCRPVHLYVGKRTETNSRTSGFKMRSLFLQVIWSFRKLTAPWKSP